jgi:hypothetical protein
VAFPQIQGTPTDSIGSGNATSHTLNLPTAVAREKWLIVVAAKN